MNEKERKCAKLQIIDHFCVSLFLFLEDILHLSVSKDEFFGHFTLKELKEVKVVGFSLF